MPGHRARPTHRAQPKHVVLTMQGPHRAAGGCMALYSHMTLTPCHTTPSSQTTPNPHTKLLMYMARTQRPAPAHCPASERS
eukprot:364476-Chlamydomonas_euryale.AAC.5